MGWRSPGTATQVGFHSENWALSRSSALGRQALARYLAFLVCYFATQLAIQLQQECIQVVCSNREARKRPTKLNGTPATDLGSQHIRIRRYTNKSQPKKKKRNRRKHTSINTQHARQEHIWNRNYFVISLYLIYLGHLRNGPCTSSHTHTQKSK